MREKMRAPSAPHEAHAPGAQRGFDAKRKRKEMTRKSGAEASGAEREKGEEGRKGRRQPGQEAERKRR